jgi:uncharacterized delta-60 repeat protein
MMKRLILFAASIFLLLSNELFSQPGNLDPSFGMGGIVTTKIGSSLTPGTMYSAVKQSDDKIVAVGEYWNGYDADFLIARYNPDGDLDTSFGINGIVTTQVEFLIT